MKNQIFETNQSYQCILYIYKPYISPKNIIYDIVIGILRELYKNKSN